uniref:Mitochondrial intermembrane space import and assembly protein 40 n=1 Tax=Piliocolobus tephrosceles TaxID=591936 RepID=A0A8C9GVE0_9PRIM
MKLQAMQNWWPMTPMIHTRSTVSHMMHLALQPLIVILCTKKHIKHKELWDPGFNLLTAKLLSGPRLILPNGNINWNCPCLGGMASGPCGEQFKSAFSCFHYSTEEIKGSDCVDQFRAMQECMQKYPDLYPQEDEDEEEEREKKPAEQAEETAPTEATATKEEEGSS